MKKKNPIPFSISIKIVYLFFLTGLGALIWLWNIQVTADESLSSARVTLPIATPTVSNESQIVENRLVNAEGQEGEESQSVTKHSNPPANPNASLATRQLLTWLQRTDRGCQIISGQDIQMLERASDTYRDLVEELQTETGRWVGLIGADYSSWGENKDWSNTNRILINHWQQGGLVELTWTANNPWTGGDAWDTSQVDLRQLLVEDTPLHTKWIASLDHVADGLDQLQQAGVVVLWRPFHGINGDWFWWGTQGHPTDAKPMQALWRQMFDYFTNERKLNNLLWVYSIAHKDPWKPSIQTIDFYYPGEDYVDIVGQGTFEGNLEHFMYQELLTFGKPIALTEFGASNDAGELSDGSYDYLTLIQIITSKYPQTIYWLSWSDWREGDKQIRVSIRYNRNATMLLNHDCVVTRDEIHWQTMQP